MYERVFRTKKEKEFTLYETLGKYKTDKNGGLISKYII